MAWGRDAKRGHSLMTSQNEGGLVFEVPKSKKGEKLSGKSWEVRMRLFHCKLNLH